MKNETAINPFTIRNLVSHLEVATVTFDQWILTIALRVYSKRNQEVEGMVHVIFNEVEGFRLLDEGAMLKYPWKNLTSLNESFVHCISEDGWLAMELEAGNLHLPKGAREFIVKTSNECVSVISYSEPSCAVTDNKWLKTEPQHHGAALVITGARSV